MNLLLFLAQSGADEVEDLPSSIATIAVTFVVMVSIVIAVAIWQGMATWRARMSIAREEAYRKLAETAEASNTRVADLLASMRNDLADARSRIAEMERILKEVD